MTVMEEEERRKREDKVEEPRKDQNLSTGFHSIDYANSFVHQFESYCIVGTNRLSFVGST